MNTADDKNPKYSHVKSNRATAAVRGAAWSAVNAIVPTILNSLVFIISSRILTPHDFGLVALAASIISLISAFAPAALGEALIQQLNVRSAHLNTVFWVCLSSSTFIYVLLIIFAELISAKFGQTSVSAYLPLLGLKIIFDLAAVVPNALIARAMSFHLIAIRTIVATVLSAIFCITLLLKGFGVWALITSLLSVSIITCIAAFLGARWIPEFRFEKNALRELYHYGFFASANRFLQLMNLDQLIIGTIINPAALGIFNFSRRLFQILNDVIAGALTSVSHTLLSSMQNEKQKVRDAFLMATYGSSLISLPAFVGLAAVAAEIIPLVFGSQWVEAIWPTRWFCIIGLMSCIGVIQASLITSQGKSNWWFYYQLIRQVVTIVSIIILYPFGISTIVFAMAVQTILFWPVTLIMVSKIIEIKISDYFKQFAEPFAASLIMLAFINITKHYLHNFGLASLLTIEILLGAFIYFSAIFILSGKKIIALKSSILKNKKQ